MRAIVQTEFGGPDVLKVAEVADPVAIASQVLVRVKAASINSVDTYARSGGFKPGGDEPFILGWDISGLVEVAPPGVHRFKVGDEVFGLLYFPMPAKTYAELVVAPPRQLAKKPQALSHEQAAGLGLAGLTAWQGLIDSANLRSGQRVLVHGAAGGVGHLAVQIAKARGAYVVATASATKQDFVRTLGADQVIDYRAKDFTHEFKDIDIVFETTGEATARQSLEVLKPGGKLITIVDTQNQALADDTKQRGLEFFGTSVEPDCAGLEQLVALVEAGQLKVHVGQTFPLEQAAQAHEHLKDSSVMGKTVLIM